MLPHIAVLITYLDIIWIISEGCKNEDSEEISKCGQSNPKNVPLSKSRLLVFAEAIRLITRLHTPTGD
jgi:hypothetical protein